jgi:hypothetical protein
LTKDAAVVIGTKLNKWDNPKNARCEAGRHFRNNKRECLKDKTNELAVNSKNIRDLYTNTEIT